MPANTVYVGRGTRYGNPYVIRRDKEFGDYEVEDMTFEYKEDANAYAVLLYKGVVLENIKKDPHYYDALIGKNLACFCSLDMPCHADVIIEFLT